MTDELRERARNLVEQLNHENFYGDKIEIAYESLKAERAHQVLEEISSLPPGENGLEALIPPEYHAAIAWLAMAQNDPAVSEIFAAQARVAELIRKHEQGRILTILVNNIIPGQIFDKSTCDNLIKEIRQNG